MATPNVQSPDSDPAVSDEVNTAVSDSTPGTIELIARGGNAKGSLEITVVRACIETYKERCKSANIYVTVELGGTVLTTKVTRQTYTPMFNDTFQFEPRNIAFDSVLHVKVKNFRMLHKHLLVGELTLHLGDLDMGKVQQYQLKTPKSSEPIATDEPRGTDLNTSNTDETDSTSKAKDLHAAALAGDIGKVNKFLGAGHDVNEMKTMRLFPQHPDNDVRKHEFEGVTPLHCAVVAGNDKIVSRLLQSGADPLMRNKDLQSPWHTAAWFGHHKIMETFLSKYELDYQQEMKRKGHSGPLSTANTSARPLSRMGPAILKSMVMEAAMVDNVAFLNVLVGQIHWPATALAFRDHAGNTPLHIAVQYQSKKFAQALLDMNSSLLQKENFAGQTVFNVDGNDMKYILMGTTKRVGSLKSDSHFEEDSLGYSVYAKTVADILTDESTTMPITVGIYARRGQANLSSSTKSKMRLMQT